MEESCVGLPRLVPLLYQHQEEDGDRSWEGKTHRSKQHLQLCFGAPCGAMRGDSLTWGLAHMARSIRVGRWYDRRLHRAQGLIQVPTSRRWKGRASGGRGLGSPTPQEKELVNGRQ